MEKKIMTRRILTRHPEKGKHGVNISREKYETVRAAILAALNEKGELTFGELTRAVERKLGRKFEGSVSWYVTTVKLDVEARGLIRRVPGSSPQRLRLAQR